MTKFSIVNSQSSTLAKAKMTVKIAPKKVYRRYDSNYLQQCLIDYASMTDGTSIGAFLKGKESIAKSSFLRHYNKSGLAELKKMALLMRLWLNF